MSDKPTDQDGKAPPGTVLSFPGGRQVDPEEVGAGFIVGQSGAVPVAEIVDQGSIDRELRERDRYVSEQPLVRAIEQAKPAADVLDEVIKEVAEELSHLKFERKKAAREGKNTANYTISRIASLRQLADVLQKRQENARHERLDLQSPRFKQILHLWMAFLYDSMSQAGVNEGTIDAVFKIMDSNMVDWERRIADTE